jgi:hypothetical protein
MFRDRIRLFTRRRIFSNVLDDIRFLFLFIPEPHDDLHGMPQVRSLVLLFSPITIVYTQQQRSRRARGFLLLETDISRARFTKKIYATKIHC